MASSFNAIFGGSTGVPLGAIVAGQLANTTGYLPCDGGDYVSATYPQLDKTNLQTFGTNTPVARTLPASQVWSATANNGSVIVAVSSTSGTAAASSSDGGVTWVARTIPSGVYIAVTWNGTIFCAVGTNVCATSPDGVTWTARSIATGYSWYGVAWTAQSGLFVAVCYNATADYATSPDGITWTTRVGYLRDASQWSYVNNVNGQFWITPQYGPGSSSAGYYATSDDGLTWVYRTLPTGASTGCYNSVYFAGKYYMSIANGGAIYVSTDATNWVALAPNINSLTGIYGLWVAGGYLWAASSASDTKAWYSVDGVVWKFKTLPSAQAWGWFTSTPAGVVVLPRASSAAAASVSFDTTKFRTPKAAPVADTDRLYIKVA